MCTNISHARNACGIHISSYVAPCRIGMVSKVYFMASISIFLFLQRNIITMLADYSLYLMPQKLE